jgi:regulator of protease activity HflC (stomatin/prohibitin superfamily)
MRGKSNQWRVPAIIIGGVIVMLFALMILSLAYTPVKYGTVALITRFGGLTGAVLDPGLHWRTPFIDRVVTIPTVVISYETSDDPSLSGADYRDYPVNAQTTDGQQVTIKYTVLFRIPPDQAVTIAQNVGQTREIVENVVKAHSRNLVRIWAQNYTAEDLYSGEGIFAYEEAVRNALRQQLTRYGVTLDDFLVRKVEFEEDYTQAIEQQQIAQEAIETAKYQSDAAEYEKARQIRLAEAEAERTKLLAQADAERQRLLSDAEAYGIEVRGMALQQYPELVQWEFVRNLENVQWGILPSEGVSPLIPLPAFAETQSEPTSTLPAPLTVPTETSPGQ